MSFVREEDVHAACERMMKAIFKEAIGFDLQTPFPRLDYFEAMRRFGSDKPDQRYTASRSPTCRPSSRDSKLQGLRREHPERRGRAGDLREISDYSRSEIDKLTDLAKVHGAKGLAWIKWTDGRPGHDSLISKFLTPEEIAAIQRRRPERNPGRYTFFAADKEITASTVLGAIRKEIIARVEAPSRRRLGTSRGSRISPCSNGKRKKSAGRSRT